MCQFRIDTLEIGNDGRIWHDGIDITWNDRMIGQLVRKWITKEVKGNVSNSAEGTQAGEGEGLLVGESEHRGEDSPDSL